MTTITPEERIKAHRYFSRAALKRAEAALDEANACLMMKDGLGATSANNEFETYRDEWQRQEKLISAIHAEQFDAWHEELRAKREAQT